MSQIKELDSEAFYPAIPGDLVTPESPVFSSDLDSDPQALKSLSHRPWRSALPQARVGVDLGRLHSLSGVVLFWWGRCWAEEFQLEVSVTGMEWSLIAEQSQCVNVYEVNRVSLFSLKDKRCRYLRVSMKKGSLDPHFRRYFFGIGKLVVLGEVCDGEIGVVQVPSVPEELPKEDQEEKEQGGNSSKVWLTLCQTSNKPWSDANLYRATSWTEHEHRLPYLFKEKNIFKHTDYHFLSRASRRNYHLHAELQQIKSAAGSATVDARRAFFKLE